MRKFSKMLIMPIVLLMLASFNLGCYKGDSMHNPEKTQIQPIDQGTNVVDSVEVQKEVQIKIDSVNSGISSVQQGTDIKNELNDLRETAKSPDLIKKIDEIIQQIEIQIVALKLKEDLKNSVAKLTGASNALLENMSSFPPKLDSKELVQKTIEVLNQFLSDIQYQKEMIAQLIKVLENDPAWADALKTIQAQLEKLTEKEKEIQTILASAIIKQKEFLTSVELEAKIAQSLDLLLKEIGNILAKASVQFDINKINTAESLINSIKVVSDIGQLDMIKSKLSELELYVRQSLDELKQKRAELMAIIAKTESLYKEAVAINSVKAKEIEAYLKSLKQANLDSDIAKLEKLLTSITSAYAPIAEKQLKIKEEAIKTGLIKEYNDLKAQYDVQIVIAQNALREVQNALKQKEFIEGEIEKGNINEDLLKKLSDIQIILNKTDLQAILLLINELQGKINSLKERSGSYVPDVIALSSQISQLNSNLESALELLLSALESIPGIIEFVNEGIKDIKNKENPAKEEIAISEGENQKISESLLRNLLKYAKVKNGEIIFYQFVQTTEERSVKYKKKVRSSDGKYQIVENNKPVKHKKLKKVPYKKWKLEFLSDEGQNEKKITLEVYESLYQDGAWTVYKRYGYFILKDLWYDRFQEIVENNDYQWIKTLIKEGKKQNKADVKESSNGNGKK